MIKKHLPAPGSDAEADLSEYDLSGGRTMQFKFEVTIAAMKEARQGGLKSFDSAQDLIADLQAKD